MSLLRRLCSLRRRPLRPVVWTVLVLSLTIAFPASSADIFSVIYANPSGVTVLHDGSVTVDISNVNHGYIMVRHAGSAKRLKTQVSDGAVVYTYDQNSEGAYETFPLQNGSGQYKVEVFENVRDANYAKVFSKSFFADVPIANAAFLCPTQFIWYTPTTVAVAKSFELCSELSTEAEKVQALYNFVGDTILYDYIKALTVQKGYRPDLDSILASSMGICFDYASLLACMLRVQGIPAKLVMGDVETEGKYHAWNQVFIEGMWMLMDPTFKNAKTGYTESDYYPEKVY